MRAMAIGVVDRSIRHEALRDDDRAADQVRTGTHDAAVYDGDTDILSRFRRDSGSCHRVGMQGLRHEVVHRYRGIRSSSNRVIHRDVGYSRGLRER